jgi:hypothetical protein
MQYEKFEDKGQSVAVNRSTMAKRKGTKGQAKIHKTAHRNLKIE